MAENKEELKGLLRKVKEETEKSWLKTQHSKNKDHGIWYHHFMQIDGEAMESVRDFIFLAPKSLQMVTAAMKLKYNFSFDAKLWPT